MTNSGQRHQHGVKKNLAEVVGGLLAGAALVLFVRGLLGRRAQAPSSSPSTNDHPNSGVST